MCVDSLSVRGFLERPEPIDLSGEGVLPLQQTIERFYSAQFVEWDIPDNLSGNLSATRTTGMRSQLIENLYRSFQTEKGRPLEIPEKIEAQRQISSDNLSQLGDALVRLLQSETLSRESFASLRERIQSMLKG